MTARNIQVRFGFNMILESAIELNRDVGINKQEVIPNNFSGYLVSQSKEKIK